MHCYAVLYSVNCPAVICLPACMLLFIYGETTLVNCGPRSFFLKLIKQPTAILLLSFSANKHHHPHICLILLLQQASEIDNLTVKLGQNSLIVLCAGSTFVVDTGSAPCRGQPQQPSEESSSPTGLITLVS